MSTQSFLVLLAMLVGLSACDNSQTATTKASASSASSVPDVVKQQAANRKMAKTRHFKSKPLVSDIYTADPSAHAWDGKLYIYPSHDIPTSAALDDDGSQFAMRDYHVLSMDKVGGKVTDNGVALDIDEVPWAAQQMWAPDAAKKDGQYYLYFPAKNDQGVFHIGVAVSDSPTGPFKAQAKPIANSFSIDPAVFADDDGEHYMYFGGIWGGQLQRWQSGKYVKKDTYPADDQPALAPMVAKMSDNMLSFAEQPKAIKILNKDGSPMLAGETHKRFFEAAWVHKYQGKYYFSYSTGDTHKIVYATGDSPYGPFTYQGVILKPVVGWTSHQSIVKFKGQWYLFYHDSELSGGKTSLRNVKMMPLEYDAKGRIKTMSEFTDSKDQ